MDYSLSEEQRELQREVLQFASESLHSDIVNRERAGDFSRENWTRCARFGLLGMPVAAAYEGSERDIMTATVAMEAMGQGCRDNGLTFALNAQMWTVMLPVQHFGTETQKQRYLPRLCRGEIIGAHGITEAEAGSDVFSLSATARRAGDDYTIDGEKRYVTMAPLADFALVFASTDPDAGQWGISAFIVDLDRPGVTVGPVREKMGLRTVPMADLRFENCRVPESSRLGNEGAGVSISNSSLEWERCCILASQVGAMQRQLDECIAHARKRRQFGQPIGKFQSVSNRVADMKLRLETARLLLYRVAWLKHTGRSAVLEAALAKLHLSECFVASSMDAIRIHGGEGYMSEAGIERDLRDAVGGVIYGGTSDIQRTIIARMLGL